MVECLAPQGPAAELEPEIEDTIRFVAEVLHSEPPALGSVPVLLILCGPSYSISPSSPLALLPLPPIDPIPFHLLLPHPVSSRMINI